MYLAFEACFWRWPTRYPRLEVCPDTKPTALAQVKAEGGLRRL